MGKKLGRMRGGREWRGRAGIVLFEKEPGSD